MTEGNQAGSLKLSNPSRTRGLRREDGGTSHDVPKPPSFRSVTRLLTRGRAISFPPLVSFCVRILFAMAITPGKRTRYTNRECGCNSIVHAIVPGLEKNVKLGNGSNSQFSPFQSDSDTTISISIPYYHGAFMTYRNTAEARMNFVNLPTTGWLTVPSPIPPPAADQTPEGPAPGGIPKTEWKVQ